VRTKEEPLRTDEELSQAWCDGDIEGFKALFKRYQRRLYQVILGWTKNPSLAEDLFQESWVRVIEHKEVFDPNKNFSSWLFQIALNLTRDHWRKEKQTKITGIEQSELIDSKENPEQVLAEKEAQNQVLNALGQLSELEQEVFMLRHFGGISFSEIAELLGINLNTALSRMHQAVKHLKKIIGELQ